jgi:hypothetical protein
MADNILGLELAARYRRLCVTTLAFRWAAVPLLVIGGVCGAVLPLTVPLWLGVFGGLIWIARVIQNRQWEIRKLSIANGTCPLCVSAIGEARGIVHQCTACGCKCTAQRRWNDIREYRKWRRSWLGGAGRSAAQGDSPRTPLPEPSAQRARTPDAGTCL